MCLTDPFAAVFGSESFGGGFADFSALAKVIFLSSIFIITITHIIFFSAFSQIPKIFVFGDITIACLFNRCVYSLVYTSHGSVFNGFTSIKRIVSILFVFLVKRCRCIRYQQQEHLPGRHRANQLRCAPCTAPQDGHAHPTSPSPSR